MCNSDTKNTLYMLQTEVETIPHHDEIKKSSPTRNTR